MTSALIGFAGAVLGAVTALVGATLADRRQARTEVQRWQRDQRESAYTQVLRYLLRAANRRSEFVGGTGGAVLRREHQREWFDDLVEAQVWMRTVTRYCGPAQAADIRRAAEQLDRYVDRLISGMRYDAKDFSIWKVLQACIAAVTECARLDGSGMVIPGSASNEAPIVERRQSQQTTVATESQQAATADEFFSHQPVEIGNIIMGGTARNDEDLP